MRSQILLACGIALGLGFSATTSADVVADWNTVVLETIRAGPLNPPRASRVLAMTHLAVYDAVNAIEHTHEPYLARYQTSASA